MRFTTSFALAIAAAIGLTMPLEAKANQLVADGHTTTGDPESVSPFEADDENAPVEEGFGPLEGNSMDSEAGSMEKHECLSSDRDAMTRPQAEGFSSLRSGDLGMPSSGGTMESSTSPQTGDPESISPFEADDEEISNEGFGPLEDDSMSSENPEEAQSQIGDPESISPFEADDEEVSNEGFGPLEDDSMDSRNPEEDPSQIGDPESISPFEADDEEFSEEGFGPLEDDSMDSDKMMHDDHECLEHDEDMMRTQPDTEGQSSPRTGDPESISPFEADDEGVSEEGFGPLEDDSMNTTPRSEPGSTEVPSNSEVPFENNGD